MTNLNLGYQLNDEFRISYRVGLDVFSNEQEEVYELGSARTGGRPIDGSGTPTGGQITDFRFNQGQLYSNLNLEYSKELSSDLSLDVLLGNEINRSNVEVERITGYNFNCFR